MAQCDKLMPPLTSCPLKEIERGPNECPISWETDIKDIIQKKRTDPELYTWLMDNIGKCIVGVNIWKNDVRTGNKSISKVITESSEAIGLVLMANHWSSWGKRPRPTLPTRMMQAAVECQPTPHTNDTVHQDEQL
jgi:hypothetical protein